MIQSIDEQPQQYTVTVFTEDKEAMLALPVIVCFTREIGNEIVIVQKVVREKVELIFFQFDNTDDVGFDGIGFGCFSFK